MEEDVPNTLSGVIEVDETYVGGAWINKPIAVRRQGAKRGRGTTKQAIFGLVERERGTTRVFLVTDTKGATLIPIIKKVVTKGSAIYSDGWPAYRTLPKYGFIHAFVDHNQYEYVRGSVHTNTIEGFWAQLKKRLTGTGGIRMERMHSYVAEEVWRYNNRKNEEEANVDRLFFLLKEKFGG